MAVPPSLPKNPPPPDDALFGRTLVREGALTAEQLEAGIQAQQTMRAQGVNLRLGEVLVRQRLLTPEQVRQFLHLAGKQILHCPKCGKNYNVKNWKPGAEVSCPTCVVALASPPSDRTIDAHETHDAHPVVGAGDSRDQAGKPFGRYRLLEELGHGGMGVVWKAWDTQLKRVVALKQILAGGEIKAGALERFMREAQLAAKLAHPHIIPVHDVGVHESQHFFTTEYIAGQSLDELMKKPVPVKRALAWVKDIAEALAYAHEQGVVHRDVKPANILIDGKGQSHVMDFGLAKEVDVAGAGTGRALTLSGALMGSPQYMSPEQASGKSDQLGPATDQFSLGVVLYELLTRRPPFDGSSLRDLLSAILEREPPRPARVNARIHRDIETICLKALEKDPAKRYASMADFAADLGRYLDGEPILARRTTWAERAWRRVRRSPVVSGLAAALVVAALVSGGVWWKGRAERDSLTSQLVAELSRSATSEVENVLSYRALGDLKKSRSYRSALDAPIAELKRRAPTLAEPWYHQGRMLRALQKDTEAEEAQDRAVSLASAADATPGSRALLPAIVYERGVLRLSRYEQGLADKRDELLRMRATDRKAGDAPPEVPTDSEVEATYPELTAVKGQAEADLRRVLEFGSQGESALRSAAGALVAGLENDPQARRLLEEALAADKRMPEVYAMLARMAAAGGNHEDAAGCFERARQADRGYLPHLLGMVEELSSAAEASSSDSDEASRLRTKALQAVGEFLAIDETCVDCWTWKSYLLRSDGRALSAIGKAEDAEAAYQGALRAADQAFALNPQDPKAMDAEANIYHSLGQAKRARGEDPKAEYEKAMQGYTAQLKFKSRAGLAFWGRGGVRFHSGDLDGAIQDWTEALKINPRNDRVLLCRGVVRAEKGDFDGAIQDCTDVLNINPGSVETLNLRAMARRDKGDLDGAIQDFTEALKINPRNDLTFAGRGAAYALKGDLDAAIQDATEAVKINPRNADAFANRSGARLQKRDPEGAIQDYTEALKIDPHYADAYTNRGNARQVRGDLDEAIQDYTEALKINPRLANALVNRGIARQAEGDLDGAIQDTTEALKINPRLAEAFVSRGIARKAKGDLDGAIEDYTEALEINPRYPEALANRGNARAQKGDVEAAIDDLTKALDVAPANWPLRKQAEDALRAAREPRGK